MNFALSREENKKYVHLISDQGELIWNELKDPRSVHMICGDATVADDVYETLLYSTTWQSFSCFRCEIYC